MPLLKLVAKLCMLIVLLCAQTLPASELQPPSFPVPSHVSVEAQAVLRKPIDLSRAKEFPQTDEQWGELRMDLLQRYAPVLKQLQAEPVVIEKTTIAGVTVRIITPNSFPKANQDKVLINVHGGGYMLFGGELSIVESVPIAVAGQYKVISIDYRMPPQYPFPAAVEDSVAVYKALLKQYLPQNIAMFGTSAGGGLAAATIVQARDQGLPLPAAAIMDSPWSDLSKTGDSYYTLEAVDPILLSYDGGLHAGAKYYAGERDLKHPLISPVYADFAPGFPPSLLISGTRDLLLSCTVRLHTALRSAGMPADLLVYDAMWHAFRSNPEMAESEQALSEMLRFLKTHLGVAA